MGYWYLVVVNFFKVPFVTPCEFLDLHECNFFLLFRIVLEEMETVDSLKMRMSLRLLIPSVNFHILHNKKELR